MLDSDTNTRLLMVLESQMAGVVGFEPTDAGIKTRCLNHLATPQYLTLLLLHQTNVSPLLRSGRSKHRFINAPGHKTCSARGHSSQHILCLSAAFTA